MAEPQLSHRTVWEHRENALTGLVRRLRGEGRAIADWTVSNPTICGFAYDRQRIADGLTGPASFEYVPEPAGSASAREAIAGFLNAHGISATPGRLLLTASTSEAYSYLFRLLCNAGDNVLIPKPGYPLCDDLARLNDVALRPYRYHYAGSWHLDEESLQEAVTSSTRAIVLIHPNNPTGNFLSSDEQRMIARIARERGVALIADEVFLPFPFNRTMERASCANLDAPLVFTLNGLSKMTGLPQLKLGWVTVQGDERVASEAMRRLEMIADTYLSVNTPVQVALPGILATADVLGESIRRRVAENYAQVRQLMDGSPVTALHAEGGWSAILQLPRVMTDEEWALLLLEHAGILVYPGHFFDIEMEGCVAVSLLPGEHLIGEYCRSLRATVEGVTAP